MNNEGFRRDYSSVQPGRGMTTLLEVAEITVTQLLTPQEIPWGCPVPSMVALILLKPYRCCRWPAPNQWSSFYERARTV